MGIPLTDAARVLPVRALVRLPIQYLYHRRRRPFGLDDACKNTGSGSIPPCPTPYRRRRRPSGLDDACVQGAAFTLWVSRRTQITGVVVLADLMMLVCKARHSHCGCLVGLSYHRRRRPSGLDDACVQGAAFTLWVSRRTRTGPEVCILRHNRIGAQRCTLDTRC